MQTPTTTAAGNKNNIVEFNYLECGETHYCRGIEVNGPDGMATGNIFRNNIINGASVRSQIGGNNNKFYNNLFVNTIDTPATDVSNVSEGVTFATSGSGFTFICHDNEFYNNTIVSTFNEGIRITTNSGIMPIDNIIKNNIVVDSGKGGDNLNIALWASASITSSNTIQNNIFFDELI